MKTTQKSIVISCPNCRIRYKISLNFLKNNPQAKCKKCNHALLFDKSNIGNKKNLKKQIFNKKVLAVAGIGLFLSTLAYISYYTSHKDIKKEKAFNRNIDHHYLTAQALYDNKNYVEALNQFILFEKYQKLDYKDILNVGGNIKRELTIISLVDSVKKTPKFEHDIILKIYKKLLTLNPQNNNYKKQVTFYEVKAKEKRARDWADLMKTREKRERDWAESNKKSENIGARPKTSSWDVSIACVKDYIKRIAHDPKSIKFEQWGSIRETEEGWSTWCKFRGKNAFGAYVYEIKRFIIRHDRVVRMEDYQIIDQYLTY